VNFIFLFFLFLSNLLGVKVLYVNKYFNKYFIRKKNTKFLGIAGVGVNKDDIDLILKNRYVIEKAKDIYTIAFIGRHETSKGYDLFVEIANKNSSNQINFITIGGNSINNSNSKLTNLGRMHRQDIFNYYKNIDILIMPSFSEGIGMSMVECCIAGIPTIASQTDGSKQFIINNYNGLIINSRKPELYINAIKKIINNYDKFSRNCIEYSEKNNNFLSKPILDI
jgi:glycosyltransferase involved in cell wall biosynthesis